MTIEHTPDGTPYLSDQSYLSETPPYTQELAQIIDAGTGGGVCDIKDSKFNDLQPADPVTPFPIGMLAPFMGENAPDGWLLCDGRSYDAAYFYALAEANPDFHNDGAFRVPDLRGRSPIGTSTDVQFPDWGTGPVAPIDLGIRKGDWRMLTHTHSYGMPSTTAGGINNPGKYFSTPYSNNEPAQTAHDGLLYTGPAHFQPGGADHNWHPVTGVNFIVYTGKPTLDTNGDILAECGQGAEIAPVTTRMMIEARLAQAGIGEEEIKMLKEQLEEIKKTEAK